MNIISAETPEYILEIIKLFREYEDELGIDLSFQNFTDELAGLPGRYAPPEGALLLAQQVSETAGCVALRKLDAGSCEMKRLFVRPRFRNRGIGRILAEQIIFRARQAGYQVMYLDTLNNLGNALSLYRSLGFQETDSYYQNPLEGVVYLQRDLTL